MKINFLSIFEKHNMDSINGILFVVLAILAIYLFSTIGNSQTNLFGYGSQIYINDRFNVPSNNYTYERVPMVFIQDKQITNFTIYLRLTRGNNQEVRLYLNRSFMNENILENNSKYHFLSLSSNLNQGGQITHLLITNNSFIIVFVNNNAVSSQYTVVVTIQTLPFTPIQTTYIWTIILLIVLISVIFLFQIIMLFGNVLVANKSMILTQKVSKNVDIIKPVNSDSQNNDENPKTNQ